MTAPATEAPVGAGAIPSQRPSATGWRARSALLVAAWFAILAVARVVGIAYVHAHHTPLAVGAVPWVGSWAVDATYLPALALAGLVAAAGVRWLPTIAIGAQWRLVLAASGLATAAFSAALVLAGPASTHWRSIKWGYGQHTDLVSRAGPADYLATYVAQQPHLGGHLRAHPPGFVLLLWGFERLGLQGTGFHLVLVLAAGAVSSIAVLVAFREVAGDRLARAAAPFVAIGPVAVWHTNPDVVFGSIALSGVCMVVVATGRQGPRRALLGLGGGVLFAAGLLCTYGVVVLVIPAIAVGLQRRAFGALALAAAGAGIGLLLPALWGFWWPAGLAVTRGQYRHSLATPRGYRYWLLGNAATFLALLGPATVVGLGRLRGAGARALVFGGLSCAVVAGLSGMSSAETERIWQPFAPLVLLAGAALWARAEGYDVHTGRRWLALQAVVAIAFQATLQSNW